MGSVTFYDPACTFLWKSHVLNDIPTYATPHCICLYVNMLFYSRQQPQHIIYGVVHRYILTSVFQSYSPPWQIQRFVITKWSWTMNWRWEESCRNSTKLPPCSHPLKIRWHLMSVGYLTLWYLSPYLVLIVDVDFLSLDRYVSPHRLTKKNFTASTVRNGTKRRTSI